MSSNQIDNQTENEADRFNAYWEKEITTASISGLAITSFYELYCYLTHQVQCKTYQDTILGEDKKLELDITFNVYHFEVLNLPTGREFYLDIPQFGGRTRNSVNGILDIANMDIIDYETKEVKITAQDIRNKIIEDGCFSSKCLNNLPNEIKNTMLPTISFSRILNTYLCVEGEKFIAHTITVLAKNYNIMRAYGKKDAVDCVNNCCHLFST